MKDEILENVWEAKEAVSRNAPEGFEKLGGASGSSLKTGCFGVKPKNRR